MTAIVPFGKYKGLPIETMAADPGYRDWLIAQPWLADRYPNVYKIIVNYGGPPQDSPEHNEMQAQFLNSEWCLALADAVVLRYESPLTELDADPLYQKFAECVELHGTHREVYGTNFEVKGWDVVFGVQPARIQTQLVRLVPPLPACACDCGNHNGCRFVGHTDGTVRHVCAHEYCRDDNKRTASANDHCNTECYWHRDGPLTSDQREWLRTETHEYYGTCYPRFKVELKPVMGDDYPAVLRQVKGYEYDSSMEVRCVIVRRFGTKSVGWDKVMDIFAKSEIVLISENAITRRLSNEGG